MIGWHSNQLNYVSANWLPMASSTMSSFHDLSTFPSTVTEQRCAGNVHTQLYQILRIYRRISLILIVGEEGFEPLTPASKADPVAFYPLYCQIP